MKGLLIKDLRILLCQKSSVAVFIGISILMLINGMDVSFCIGYAAMMMAILLLGTISYDEHENGMSFLLTLPVGRKEYVFSKYGFIVGGVVLIECIMLLAVGIYEKVQPSGLLMKEYVMMSLIMVAVAVMLIALMLPVNLKFGVEKSRFVLMAVTGVMGAVIAFFVRYSDHMPYVLRRILKKLSLVTPERTVLVLSGISLAALIFSVWISIRIIEKRDY